MLNELQPPVHRVWLHEPETIRALLFSVQSRLIRCRDSLEEAQQALQPWPNPCMGGRGALWLSFYCHRHGEHFEAESFNTFTSIIVRPRMKSPFINPLDIKSFRPFRM